MSFKRWVYKYNQFSKRMGPRVFFYVFLAFVAAILAHSFGPLIPDKVVDNLGRLDVQPILQSLSGTMLTISTFSLSIVVSANSNAVASTTPRAFRLLLEDKSTQDMLARFLGAFVFSTITLVILPLGYYGGGGRIILLGFTAWLIILIIATFIRWVMAIRELGSMSYALGKIETATNEAIDEYLEQMLSGCNPLTKTTELDQEELAPITFSDGLYIHIIDEPVLQGVAENHDLEIYLNMNEGDFVAAYKPVCFVRGDVSEQALKGIRKAIVLGESRNMESDPSYGILMLGETASKALSAAVNDAGTAKGCIHTAYRLFKRWQDNSPGRPRHNRLWKRYIDYEQMLSDFYEPITHDAGDVISVQCEVIASLGALYGADVATIRDAAAKIGHRCYERAMAQMSDPHDQAKLTRAFEQTGIA